MKKVNVLLSAYNGEKYIKAQIESILQQDYPNIELYIRDDGSKDGTLEVLKEYENYENIHILKGKNKGFIKSFFSILEICSNADYFAYADQDDVWFPEKISRAVEMLERESSKIPVLYFSNYDFYNSDLEFVAHQKTGKKCPTFCNAVVDCMPLGFTCVFNKKAWELMKQNIPKHSCGHDWWTYMVCQGMGKVIYDERPSVKYRRHNQNVSAGGMSFFKFQIWRFKKFFLNDYFANIREMLREYETYYKNSLSKKDQKLLSLFTKEGYHIGSTLKKVFYPHRFRQTIIDELMVRFIFLIGKL